MRQIRVKRIFEEPPENIRNPQEQRPVSGHSCGLLAIRPEAQTGNCQRHLIRHGACMRGYLTMPAAMGQKDFWIISHGGAVS